VNVSSRSLIKAVKHYTHVSANVPEERKAKSNSTSVTTALMKYKRNARATPVMQ